MVPKRMFFTKGTGYHKNRLQSFELGLRNAGIAHCNLVKVSSIYPPHCKIVSRKNGISSIGPGQIVYCVMAQGDTNEPNRLVSAAIGFAIPKEKNRYGYLSEHHAYGETVKTSSDFAEDLAATMLATTMGIELDPDIAWDQRKQIYKVNQSHSFVSRSIAQSAKGHKNGLWTTVVALAVFLMD
ncbi:MAG: arginine decarboxylase, pyruvoyl-dependent [Thermodesulfobacteriota bacterium]|nr:arginine decarboxylase, pyruvoyl-dependent [Thermodesulfobacteriota bacterium]